jgi:hypothetical protein
MAKDHRRVDAELVQEVLLDDPGFLREIVERVVPAAAGGRDDPSHRKPPPTSEPRGAPGST